MHRCSVDNPLRRFDVLIEHFNEFCELVYKLSEDALERFWDFCEELDEELLPEIWEEKDDVYLSVVFNSLSLEDQNKLIQCLLKVFPKFWQDHPNEPHIGEAQIQG